MDDRPPNRFSDDRRGQLEDRPTGLFPVAPAEVLRQKDSLEERGHSDRYERHGRDRGESSRDAPQDSRASQGFFAKALLQQTQRNEAENQSRSSREPRSAHGNRDRDSSLENRRADSFMYRALKNVSSEAQ